jgi:cell division protein FtsW (lipid II flippase)
MSSLAPGPGPYALSLNTAPFYFLVAILALFIGMLAVLHAYYPNRKRGFEGYLSAAGVSLAFLVVAVALVVILAMHDPNGDRTSYALYETVLTGYWLAFAIPVVTVGSSVQARSRGSIRWLVPSVLVAIAMFFAISVYYFAVL